MKVKERVYMKRKVDKKTWTQIASEVKNEQGDRPYWKVVRAAYWQLTGRTRTRKDKYHNCGRKASVTPALATWLVKKILSLRMKMDCTSGELSRLLAKEKHVQVTESCVRKVLNKKGYHYFPRDLKPKYDKKQREKRVDFAGPFSTCTANAQKEKVHFCMDGVVFTRPPAKLIDRENYVHTPMPTPGNMVLKFTHLYF